MPQEIQLPDGRILVIPENVTLDQRVALRNKLGAQYSDPRTGKGMEQRAVQQSRSGLASRVQPSNLGTVTTGPPLMSMQPGLPSPAQVPENAERMAEGAAIGAPVGGLIAGGTAAIPAIARTVLGGAGGAYAGGKAGRYLGGETGETVGKVVGGAAGGYLGATGRSIPTRASLLERILARQPAATEAAPAAGAAAETAAAPVTRVPEPRPLFPGENPANMASVPRGQLPSLAQQGKPGAVEQLQQLGERPIITPRGSDIPANPPLQGTLEERIRGSVAPPVPEQPPVATARQPKTSGTLAQRLAERKNNPDAGDDWLDKILGPLPKKWMR